MLIDTKEEDERAAIAFDNETLLGFDSETKPSLVPGVTNKTAIIQVASASVCGIWRVRELDALPPTLARLLTDPTIIKASQGATPEVATVYREFSGLKCQGFVDLHLLAMGLRCNPRSLQGLCALFLHKRLLKAERISNWEQIPLSPSQLEYAATDAWVSRQVLEAMRAAFNVDKLSFERPVNPDDLGLVPRSPVSVQQPLRTSSKAAAGSSSESTAANPSTAAGMKALANLCVEKAYVLTVESFEPAMGGFRCLLKVNLRHNGRPHVLQCRSNEVHTSIRAAQDDAADVALSSIHEIVGAQETVADPS
ncbi:hypothetical protein FOL47_001248 [Perkinsus chesapeaki]|uniref:3'-5' exonuclease domain-containing protein n=1 Tax=Perkinsus chesapeaki TaxID=330153 RepID=A0A7J6MKM6_PERCH|nr:hypothetical protein FOL47_001248 [Perkinsus chesapeaki]